MLILLSISPSYFLEEGITIAGVPARKVSDKGFDSCYRRSTEILRIQIANRTVEEKQRFEWSKMSGRANTLGVFAIASQNNSIRLVISLLDVEEMIRTLIKAEYEMKENECLESG